MKIANLFESLPLALEDEQFENLLKGQQFRVERIVSMGHTTPDGQWYDQDLAEWVLLLAGAAKLQFAGESSEIDLRPGDHLNIPPHCRHRVTWTSPDETTVWLAIHYDADS